MTKTDWRSEFRDKMNSMITPIQQRKMTAMSMQNETEDFIEQTRLDAQIEVLEESMKFQEDLCDGLGDIGNWTEDKIEELKQK